MHELADVNRPERIEGLVADYLGDHPRARDRAAERVAAPRDNTAPGTTGTYDLVITGDRVLADGSIGPRQVAILDGRIAAVASTDAILPADRIVTLSADETLLPGLVDTHVHVNEPGRTTWEGFATATAAAAAGGVTTIIDMPLNSVPSTVNRPALDYKQLVAAEQLAVDVGFWGGAVPGNYDDLAGLSADGVFGFKSFLLDSGVDEFPPLDPDQLESYMSELARLDAMMIVHAEDPDVIGSAPDASGPDYAGFLASRPDKAEELAIQTVIERVRRTGVRAHILHLSSAAALPLIAEAKRDGLDLSVETCPHYLSLDAEHVPDGGTAYKCCPPIREAANTDRLWEGLLDGTIDYIASDHSPATAELKEATGGDFGTAWGGISSLQLELPVVWSAARRRGIGLDRVADWVASRPAGRVGLAGKGSITVGNDADLVVFAADDRFRVDAGNLEHRNPVTAYHGRDLAGVVRQTYLRGAPADESARRGRLLRHSR